MINLYKIFLFLICCFPARGFSAPEAEAVVAPLPPSSMAQIKTLFAEKKVDDAIKILRQQYKSLLRTDSDRRELSRWLSLFLFDDTMATHEKAMGLEETKAEEAEAEYKKALDAEPYNKAVISHYLSFLIGTERFRPAQSFVESKLVEQPYMALYKLYGAHAQALLGQKTSAPPCDSRDFDEVELKYCYLVQLIVKVSALDPKAPLEQGPLKTLAKRAKLPDAQYWLWKANGDQGELKKYVSLCQSLSVKDKKNYKIVPGVCNKLEDAVQKLKTVAIWYPHEKVFLSSL
jgi:hypothetical protein